MIIENPSPAFQASSPRSSIRVARKVPVLVSRLVFGRQLKRPNTIFDVRMEENLQMQAGWKSG
jgi:hypothetical protein